MEFAIRGTRVQLDDEMWDCERIYSWTSGEQRTFRACDMRWHIGAFGALKYVVAYVHRGRRPMAVSLHRLVTQCPHNRVVDHANGDTFDNRFANLRVATVSQNTCNTPRRKNSSGLRGVGVFGARYEVAIGVRGQRVYIGRYSSAEHAAMVYDACARLLHGEFATVNYPLRQMSLDELDKEARSRIAAVVSEEGC